MAQETSRWNTMTLFDDNPPSPLEENLDVQPSPDQPAESTPADPFSQPLAGDPLSSMPVCPSGSFLPPNLPEDLRISWSWPHLLVFVIFVLARHIALGIAVVVSFPPEGPTSQARRP